MLSSLSCTLRSCCALPGGSHHEESEAPFECLKFLEQAPRSLVNLVVRSSATVAADSES